MNDDRDRVARMKSDGEAMLDGLPDDYDPRRVAEAAAAVLGTALGVMMAEDMLQLGKANEALLAYFALAEEWACASERAETRRRNRD